METSSWKFALIVSALCLVTLAFAGAAEAQYPDDELDPLNPTDGDPCPGMTAEECFWGGSETGSGGTTTQTCTRSSCWYCLWSPSSTPQNQCSTTSQTIAGSMGCTCDTLQNTGCDLKRSSCTIVR